MLPPWDSDGVHSSSPAPEIEGRFPPVTLDECSANDTPSSCPSSVVIWYSFGAFSSNVSSGARATSSTTTTESDDSEPWPSPTVNSRLYVMPPCESAGVHPNTPVAASSVVPDMPVPLYEYASVLAGMSSSLARISKDSLWFVMASISTDRVTGPSSSPAAGGTGRSPTPTTTGGVFTSITRMSMDIVDVSFATSVAASSTV